MSNHPKARTWAEIINRELPRVHYGAFDIDDGDCDYCVIFANVGDTEPSRQIQGELMSRLEYEHDCGFVDFAWDAEDEDRYVWAIIVNSEIGPDGNSAFDLVWEIAAKFHTPEFVLLQKYIAVEQLAHMS